MAGLDRGLLDEILGRLEGYKLKKEGPEKWRSQCPAHLGGGRNFAVRINREGRILLTCFSHRCSLPDIKAALGLEDSRELQVAVGQAPVRYTYRGPDGTPVFSQLCLPGGKAFRQETWDPEAKTWRRGGPGDGNYVPYKLPELIKGVERHETVFYVEGEKDVRTLMDRGFVATTHAGGASGWKRDYAKWFRGASVVVVPDRDEPGQQLVRDVRRGLEGVAAEVRVLELPYPMGSGKDVSDYLAKDGNSVTDFERLLSSGWKLDAFMADGREVAVQADAEPPDLHHYGMVGLGPEYEIPGVGGGVFMVVGARPGVGKSSWTIELTWRMLADGLRVMFASYDEPMHRIIRYLAASCSPDYRFALYEDPACRQTAGPPSAALGDWLDQLHLDGAARPIGDLSHSVGILKPDVLVVDHIAQVPPKDHRDRGPDAIREVVVGLRGIANRHDIAVIAISQINRTGAGENERHGLEHLYGGDAIGQHADVVLGLQRPIHRSPEEGLTKAYWERATSTLNKWERLVLLYTIKNRLGMSEGKIHGIRAAGAERRFFPFHPPSCECDKCADHRTLVKAHSAAVHEVYSFTGGRDAS